VLTQAQKKPEGMLRISVPVILAQEPFLDFISGFLKDHAGIRIDLFVTGCHSVSSAPKKRGAAKRYGIES
jgi:hypothetical protein